MLVPCTIESVRVHVLTGQHVVLLQEKDGNRLLPIWIGPDQAHSIATRIAGIPNERPLTHDLMMDMLTKLGAEVTRIVVKELVSDESGNGVFHGSLFMQLQGRELEIDCFLELAVPPFFDFGSTGNQRPTGELYASDAHAFRKDTFGRASISCQCNCSTAY